MPQKLGDNLLNKWLKRKVITSGTINGIANYKDAEGNLYSLNVNKGKPKETQSKTSSIR